MASETETPSTTLETATQAVNLPRRAMVLLGTVTGKTPSALVRVRPGEIRTVKLGDSLDNYTVVAVESGTLHLMRGGRSRKLEVPEG